MNNSDIQMARFMAALKATPDFTLRCNERGEVNMYVGNTTRRMVTASPGGMVSRKSVYEGRLTDAHYLGNVTPILFNGFSFDEHGAYEEYKGGVVKIMSFYFQSNSQYHSNKLLEVLVKHNGVFGNQNLCKLTVWKRGDMANCLFTYRKFMTLGGVNIRDGKLDFSCAAHNAVNALMDGACNGVSTIIEEIEQLGYFRESDKYTLLVDKYVTSRALLDDNSKRHLVHVLNAISFMIRSELTVNDDETLTMHGRTFHPSVLLTA